MHGFVPCLASLMPAAIDSNAPQFSIVVPIYNDWELLEECLGSLDQQRNPPTFEVIIVDDGSRVLPLQSILQFENRFPMMILQQAHTSIAAARNRGVANCKGRILFFTDADC